MNACRNFAEMPGHPRTCWACGAPKRDHKAEPEQPDPCPICGGDHDRITREDCPEYKVRRINELNAELASLRQFRADLENE